MRARASWALACAVVLMLSACGGRASLEQTLSTQASSGSLGASPDAGR